MPRLDMETLHQEVTKNVGPDDIKVIYDIGCLNGADSFLLNRLFPNSMVIGIEGLEDNYNRFLRDKSNIEVRFFHTIINDYDGKTTFYQKEQNGIHSIFEQNLSPTKGVHNDVDCIRMDTFIKNNNLPIPDLVKVDVEGATLQCLKSFGDILQEVKVLQIETEEVEYFNGQPLEQEVLDFVESKGFFSIFKSSAINVKQNDYILLNKRFYNQ